MELISASDYPRYLCRCIDNARRRVVLTAMTVQWGVAMEPVFAALLRARRRGIRVTVLIDPYSFHPAGYDYQLYKMTNRVRAQKTQLVINELKAAGADIHFSAAISLSPFKGRNHIKISVVDNLVLTFGGVNLRDEAFTYADYMFAKESSQLAQFAVQLIEDIAHGRQQDDQKWEWKKGHTVFVDAGHPGQSIIYQTACDIVRHAKKVIYVSQMVPTGELARLLRATDYAAYFNRPAQAGFPMNLSLLFDQWAARVSTIYTKRQYIHAKCILAEMPDGTKVSLTGSHNFNWRGVAYGTKEIAVYSEEPELHQRLSSFVAHLAK